MKTKLLVFAIILSGLTSVSGWAKEKVIPVGGHPAMNPKLISFVEGNLKFNVYRDGTFTFEKAYTYRTARRLGLPAYQNHLHTAYDRFGRIRSINNIAVTYNKYGQVKSIGTLKMKYQGPHKKLVQVVNKNGQYVLNNYKPGKGPYNKRPMAYIDHKIKTWK